MFKKDSVFVHCPACGSGVKRIRFGMAGYEQCPCCANRLAYIIQVDGNVILEIHKKAVRNAG